MSEEFAFAANAALVVVGDHLVDQPAYGGWVGHRVRAATPDELADLVLDSGDGVHAALPQQR